MARFRRMYVPGYVSTLVCCLAWMVLIAHEPGAFALGLQNQSSQVTGQEPGNAGQNPTTAAQDSNTVDPSEVSAPPISQDEQIAYDQLTTDVGFQEIEHKYEVENGKDPVIPLVNYSQLMGISKDEEQTMRAILVDAFSQLREAREDWSEFHLSHTGNDPETQTKVDERLKELGMQERQIRTIAVTKLQQVLGEKTFEKVDAWVDQNETQFRTARHPDPLARPWKPDSSQTPGEQK